MTLSQLIYEIKDIYFYCEFCAFRPDLKVGCRMFWLTFYSTAFVLNAIYFCILARRLWVNHQQWKAYVNRIEEREKIAEPEVMARYYWHGDDYT